MTIQRLLFVLTAVNLALLAFLLARAAPVVSDGEVIRGRALEIVDDQGRVRASIKVHPASIFKPTGKPYPDTVMLRLIDANGRPEVKIGASVEGAGVGLVGASDTTQILLEASGALTSLRLTNEDGKQQVLRP